MNKFQGELSAPFLKKMEERPSLETRFLLLVYGGTSLPKNFF